MYDDMNDKPFNLEYKDATKAEKFDAQMQREFAMGTDMHGKDLSLEIWEIAWVQSLTVQPTTLLPSSVIGMWGYNAQTDEDWVHAEVVRGPSVATSSLTCSPPPLPHPQNLLPPPAFQPPLMSHTLHLPTPRAQWPCSLMPMVHVT